MVIKCRSRGICEQLLVV